ncbi:EF-hand domain-containing protein [Flavisphingomonas formosensis]|uniref:EF-hand domain-containing protein n=1 Tax=Flavisphingomonas formosensis TaxID=861534 RepID=UPI0018E05CE6|nr:EF-hand domain-containing protein [Sphingomonas formosensis]
MIKACSILACLFLAAPALAQSDSPPVTPPVPEAAGGGLTLDQFIAKQSERLTAMDSDGDGRISKAEMSAAPARGGRDPSRLFDAMDVNHDGYLDKNEIRAALARRFQRMDANGDGILTPEERMAGRMGRGGGRERP